MLRKITLRQAQKQQAVKVFGQTFSASTKDAGLEIIIEENF
jgi:succinate dehydrogenase flavin-adding protein (antitoxin of CptAB toxin-antitoxin module)